MKPNRILALAAALLATSTLPAADDGHGHSHQQNVAGPHGGRLLTAGLPHAEFFVMPDRKVQITFVGDDGQAIAPASQVVTVTTGERSAPVKMTFAKVGNSLVSDQPVPAGNNFPVVVQIKPEPDAKATIEKFYLNLTKCPTCQFAEYACICAH